MVEAILCSRAGDGEESHWLALLSQNILLTSSVSHQHLEVNSDFWMTRGENLSNAIRELAARMEEG